MSIKLIMFDVDGVMSNGNITYTSSGEELKSFNVKDGLAIASCKRLGIKTAIITGRKSNIVERRAKELGIDFLIQNSSNKIDDLQNILKNEKISLSEVAAIGDDLNDLKVLNSVAISFCPNNAVHTVKESVDVVLLKNGGEGAVREMLENIFKHNEKWNEFLALW